jgi:hypothetical protein
MCLFEDALLTRRVDMIINFILHLHIYITISPTGEVTAKKDNRDMVADGSEHLHMVLIQL